MAAMVLPALAGCLGQTPAPPMTHLPQGQLREFDMYVQGGTVSPRANVSWNGLLFSLTPDGPGSVPGPEIRVTEGDHVRVHLHDTAHTIHWHGVSVPWAMDGVPFMTQVVTSSPIPDGVYTYDFWANETGTYWYHCHVDAPTHIDLGLYGAFIVEPRDKSQDPPFDREATLMLADFDSTAYQVLDASGNPQYLHPPQNPGEASDYAQRNAQNAYDIGGAFIAPGATGQNATPPGTVGPREYYPLPSARYFPHYDTFMINGKSFPDTAPIHTKTGQTVRVRIINAGQLVHTMHLHGHHFLVTHKDGYPLPQGARYYADSLMLGSGERYDVYIKSNNPGMWDFHDHGGGWGSGAYAANDHAFPGGMNTMLVYDDFEHAKLPGPTDSHSSGDYDASGRSARQSHSGPGPDPMHRHVG